MPTLHKIQATLPTGTGRQAYVTLDAYVQNGVIVSPGGGNAVVVVNNTGVNMAQDALVFVSGVTDGVLEIVLADADVDDRPAMYYLPAPLLAGATGLAYTSGLSVATLNTAAAGAVDDPVFLDTTAGGWTLTAPTAADARDQIVGRVAVDDGAVGQIMWALQPGDYDIGTNEIQDLAVTLGKWALLARGSVVSGQGAGNVPTALACETDAQILIGDSADINSVPVTGSVSLDNAGLTALTAGYEDLGRPPIGYIYFTGVVADGETITINAIEYEFDDAGGGGITNPILVPGALDAATAATALVLALTTDTDGPVDGVVMAGNNATTAGVMLVGKAVGAVNFTLATTTVNAVVSAANLTNAAAIDDQDLIIGNYTVTAADVLTWARVGGNSVPVASFASVTPPLLCGIHARSGAGAIMSLATVEATLLQPNANFWVLAIDDPGAVLAATDIIGFTLNL